MWLLDLPLMVAIIGGETKSFKSLVDIYRQENDWIIHYVNWKMVHTHRVRYQITLKIKSVIFFPMLNVMWTTLERNAVEPRMLEGIFMSKEVIMWNNLGNQEFTEKIIAYRSHRIVICLTPHLWWDLHYYHKKLVQSTDHIDSRCLRYFMNWDNLMKLVKVSQFRNYFWNWLFVI